jgi:hypothetical protein
MEPFLELVDRITAHIWFFHESYPQASSFAALSAREVRRGLADASSADYSRIQVLLDLSDLSLPGNADPQDPLQQFRLHDWMEDREQPSWRPWNIFAAWRKRAELLAERREKGLQIREMAVDSAFRVLDMRSAALSEAGLPEWQDIFPLTRVEAARAPATETTQREHLGTNEDEMSKARAFAAGPSDQYYLSLATSDEVYEKIARWAIALTLDQLCDLARAFLPLKENPFDGDDSVVSSDRRKSSFLSKKIIASRRARTSNEVLTRFLLESNMDTRGREILTNKASPEVLVQCATDWLKTSEEDRLHALLDRAKLRKLCARLEVAIPFSMVLSDELDEIFASRQKRLFDGPAEQLNTVGDASGANSAPETGLPTQRAFDSSLFGLALSGGGIRSATFALGLLQGMADRNILPYIDIISSVSGGGYISSWLIAWAKRRGSIRLVQESLRGFASPITCVDQIRVNSTRQQPTSFRYAQRNQDPHADHLRPVRLLREYARYLAPQEGLLSADSWTIVSTWFRNTLLNLTILLLLFASVLLLPRMVLFILFHIQMFSGRWTPDRNLPLIVAVGIASLPFILSCITIGSRNLRTFGAYTQNDDAVSRGFDDSEVVWQIVFPLFLGGLIELAALWNFHAASRPGITSLSFLVVTLVGVYILRHYSGSYAQNGGESSRPWLNGFVLLGSGSISLLMMLWFCWVIDKFGMNTQRGLWMAGAFGPVMLMVVLGVTIMGFLGLSGTLLSEEQREWWSRLGAWLALATFGWLAVCVVCFFMPLWIAMAGVKIAAAGVAWGGVTAAGVKLAFGAKSGGKDVNGKQSKLVTAILNVAPTVFVLGLLSFASLLMFWGTNQFINILINLPEGFTKFFSWLPKLVEDGAAHRLCCTNLPMSAERVVTYYWPLMHPESIAPLLLAIILFGLCLYIAWRVDINEFSMHHFYRNRLVRAYLGASRLRAHRLPNAFTGFDLDDDIRLQRFQLNDATQVRDMVRDCKASYVGPFPVLNTALNITKGQDLGIQQRKAEAFFFSPLWSGFDFSRKQTRVKRTCLSEFGFRNTAQFGTARAGASLGTAMSISGAAFNSNAGFHTSPPLAFLLTVFGVRLGWWAGNPRGPRWDADSPVFGLLYLIYELTANTSTDKDFVLLTDGGHFENMGLYELIRRRCRFIIVADAEEDRYFKLEGIGGAIRKCRNDFGVVITLNMVALEPIGDPARSRLHYSIGTIRYPGEPECGVLVYIKASLTNDESVDLIEFGKRHEEFPHTSTADQFFDESHFESYRELGHHIASGIFQQDMPNTPLSPDTDDAAAVAGMFRELERVWKDALEEATSAEQKSAKVAPKATEEAAE